MFPLFAVVNGIICIIAFWAWIEVSRSSSSLGNPAKLYFALAYLFSAFYFALHSFFEIPIADPISIQIINIVSKLFIFTGIGFLVAASLEIHKNQERKKMIMAFFIALALISFLANIFTFSPAEMKIIEEAFIYWKPGGAAWAINFEGILILASLLVPVFIFSWKKSVTTNKDIKNMSHLISLGFSLLIISIVFNFILLPMDISPLFSMIVALGSVIFAGMGIALTVKGLLYNIR